MKDNLIARLEVAPQNSADLILEAFWEIKPNCADDRAIRAMLDAEAYDSAAITLLPEGWNWGFWYRHDWRYQNAQVWHPERQASTKHGGALTTAHAIAIAALRVEP